MRTREQLARDRLSPFIETAMNQLISEISHDRAGYDLLRKVKDKFVAACAKAWVPKKRKSRGRKRSAKDQEARDAWYATNVRDRDEDRRKSGSSETV